MNRIQQVAPLPSPVDVSPKIEVGAAQLSRSASGDCALFMPLHYEVGYAYPLLVWLHGPQDDESQLKRIMPQVSMRNYVAVGPRGPVRSENPTRNTPTYSRSTSAEYSDVVEQRIFGAIDLARQKVSIARDRVFLAGFGAGGTTAYRIALSYPDQFAGAASFGGGFPRCEAPLSRLTEARVVPLFLACGQESRKYAADQVCDDLRLLHTAGMSIDLRLYPGGDEITTQMLTDLDRWMMQRMTGEDAGSPNLRRL